MVNPAVLALIHEPFIVEVIAPGPQGPRGRDGDGSGAGKAPGNRVLEWNGAGQLTAVSTYEDASNTVLVSRKELTWTAGRLSSVRVLGAGGVWELTLHVEWDGSGRLSRTWEELP